MVQTSVTRTALAVVVATIAMGLSANADQYCGPGKRVGAENDGAGMSWKCIPDNRSGSADLNRTAAALQAGVGIVGIIGALASQMEMTDGLSSIEDDPEGHAIQSRDFNRRGMLNLQQGKFLRAALNFDLAAKAADRARNFDEQNANVKNAALARAQHALQKGLSSEKAGKISEANHHYLMAIQHAQLAGEDDLVQKIAGHNDALQSVAGAKVKPTGSNCRTVNRKFICQ